MAPSRLLFGLVATSAPTPPSYPLCDTLGAPACGNIGQVGRDFASVVPLSSASTSTIEDIPSTLPIWPLQPSAMLVQPASPRPTAPDTARDEPAARPLADSAGQIVCGNVMSKGGKERICRDASGVVVSVSFISSAGGN